MNRNEKLRTGVVVGTLLLIGGIAAVASAKPSGGGDKPKPGGGKRPTPAYCPPGMERGPLGRCRWVGPKDPGFTEDDDCPPGYAVNWRRALALANKDPNLDKYPKCVPITCAAGLVRDKYGACVPKETPDEPELPDDPFDPSIVIPAIVVDPPEIEPTDVDDIIKDYPEGASFYQMRFGEIIGWALSGRHDDAITQMMLARELFLSAREHLGMDDAAAMEWARARSINQALTNQIYDEILCGGVNDATMGTWGYCGPVAKANGSECDLNHPGPHGRAIRPLPMHPDNEMRLRQGLPLARTVSILSPAQKGNGKSKAVQAAQPGGKKSLPFLWLPGIDRKKLAQSNGKTLVFLDEYANPPQDIIDRGIADYSGTLLSTTGKTGCKGGEIDWEQD